MNKDLEDRLRDSLAEQNQSIEIEGAGPAAAASRASARGQQMSMGRGLAAMIVVACLGVMAFTQFSNGSSENVISTSDEQAAETSADSDTAEAVPADGVGEAASVEFAADLVAGSEQFFGRFINDEGQLIQVTTQPGLKWDEIDYEKQPYVVMVSDSEGVIETNAVPQDVFPTSVTYHDGVLYSVSTSTRSVNGGNDVVFSTTKDNGKSWSSTSIEMGPVPNSEFTSVWRNTSVAASDAGVLVSVQSNYWMDFAKLLPQYASEEGNFELRQTPEGVEVRDWTEYSKLAEEQSRRCELGMEERIDTDGDGEPNHEIMEEEDFEAMEECWSEIDELSEPEVIDSYTWADLGVEPVDMQNISQMFLTTDGKNFSEVSTPSGNASPYVVANDNGFIAEVYPDYNETEGDIAFEEDYRPTWFASADGSSWSEIVVPSGTCGLSTSQGATVIAQSCDNRLQVHVSTDNGSSWSPLAAIPDDAPEGHVTYANVFGGDLGFVAYRNVEPDYRLVDQEFERAMEAGASDEDLAMLEEELFGNSNRQFDVLFSADGESWAPLELPAGVSGEDSWGNEATIGANHIVLTIGTSNADGYQVRNVFLRPS